MSIPLLNSFRRLAATGANKVRRPSRYSLTTATGSKRSSADSDLLLCHVRLRRTSRFRFGCGTGCEHSEMRGYFDSPVSVGTGFTPANALSAGVQKMRARICSAFSCAMFARVVWMKLWGAKTTDLHHYSVPHELATHYFLRLTRARGERFQREWNALFDDFCRAFGHSKAREREKYPSGDHRSPIK